MSITDLRRNPGAVIDEAMFPVAVLNHNRATAYLVPAGIFRAMMEKLEDIDLAELVRKRRGGSRLNLQCLN